MAEILTHGGFFAIIAGCPEGEAIGFL